MTTLDIQGKKVQVDDSFLQLSPEDQSKTVDEIASHFQITPDSTPAPDAAPMTPYERATAGMGYGKAGPASTLRTPEQDAALGRLGPDDQSGANGALGASLTGAVQGMPIVGPAALSAVQSGAAGLSSLMNGQPYAQNLQTAQDLTTGAQAQHPNYTTGGEIAGAVAPLAAVGSYGLGARALGMEGGSLLGRAGASAASSAVIGSADTAARGGSAGDVATSGGISALIGGAVPIVGAGLSSAIKGTVNRISPTVQALLNPEQEAARRVGVALSRDAKADSTTLMNGRDEQIANSVGLPVINADRGGEVTRALVRSVANQSPEARATITKAADERFGTQGQRAVDVVKRLAGGNADDLAYQDSINQAAKLTNRPAYKAAFSDPKAQFLYTPGLQDLMQSPSMRAAVDSVPARSADRGAVQGFKEIGNPFSQNSKGDYVLKQSANGTLVSPNLEFWNQAKINLDSQISAAQRAGDKALTGDLVGLKNKLVGELDAAVPSYQKARQGAAGFFGAEDALDAGKKFAEQPRQIPEATRAHAKFNASEQKAFATGFASTKIDQIKTAGDRTNVINSMFKNQAARESIELALGPGKTKQLEAYVRVEDLADKLRGSLGNSTTARQLVELGIGAGVGGGAGYGLTGDWKGAALGAVAPRTLKYLGSKADTQVYEAMAKLLTRNDPAALKSAILLAGSKPAYMNALERFGSALSAPARAGTINATNMQSGQ